MMKRLRTISIIALVTAGTGGAVRVVAATKSGTLPETLALPVRKKQSGTAPATKKPDESRLNEKRAESRAKADPSPKETAADTPQPAEAKRTGGGRQSESHGGSPVPERAAAERQSVPETPASPSSESGSEEMVVALPARPAEEKRPGILSRAFSAVLPERARGTIFNTDYKTRSSSTVIPASISGHGLGGGDIPIGNEDAYRTSLPSDFCPTDLLRVAPELCLTSEQPIFLRREAALSLDRMFRDAASQGLKLRVFSGYRDYAHQARLYAEAVRKRGRNQKTVARPGRSEHFLGTTADVTNGQPQYLLSRSFASSPEGQWLERNAARYGWKMTVRAGNGQRSHADEPWHIRYLGRGVSGAGTPQGTRSDSLVGKLKRLIGVGK